MRLVCPHCAAAYDVPPALLAGRSAVRCARCGQRWGQQGASLPEEGPARLDAGPGELPPPKPEDALAPALGPTPAAARPRDLGLRLAWAASALVLTLGAGSAVAWRSDVMHVWPPSERLYSVLGLTR